MATKPQETDDEFSAAFANFASPGDPAPADDTAPEDTPAADDPAPGDAPAAGADTDEPAGDPAPGGGDSGEPDGQAGDPAPEAPPAAEAKPEPGNDDILARLGALLKEAPAKPEAKPEEKPAEAAPEEQEIYSAEEKEFLTSYDTDWKDVARGEALKRRGEYRELTGYIFQEIAKYMSPVQEMVEVLATRTHLNDIQSRVGDYEEIRDKVLGWVEEQPAYLQTAYKQVIQAGTVDEVTDLINRYRQATGDTAKPADPAPAKKAELSDDAKKAAKALAPVSTKRSAVPQAEDAGDFDAAFARWAAGKGN